jgi:hypothetical protein
METSIFGYAALSCCCAVSASVLCYPRVIASACQRVMSSRQELNESEAQFGERLVKYAAEAGNVFNEDLLISVFLEGLQPFAAH